MRGLGPFRHVAFSPCVSLLEILYQVEYLLLLPSIHHRNYIGDVLDDEHTSF